MKKLTILLLSIFTICCSAAYGCAGTKGDGNFEDKARDTENVQIQENAENEGLPPETPEKPEFPDGEKRGEKIPHPLPHRPHIKPGERIPRPIPIKP